MEAPKTQTTRRAPAHININSILAAEDGTSSEDEASAPRELQADDARSAIGVSIGRQQSRLTSPTTPAVEKAAALQGAEGFFAAALNDSIAGPVDQVVEQDDEDDELQSDPTSSTGTPQPETEASKPGSIPEERSPSPWRVQEKSTPRSSRARSVLRDGFSFGRNRSSSGPEAGQKSFFATFPSMPSMAKDFSFRSPFSISRVDVDEKSMEAKKRTSLPAPVSLPMRNLSFEQSSKGSSFTSSQPEANGVRTPREAPEVMHTVSELPQNLQLKHVQSRPSTLRRSTSDGSLITQRTMSRVSSLGDDSRWEDVSEQVNSRFKAIKDSFADSSIRLPSMPSISSFHVPTGFLNRERSSSSASKSLSEDVSVPTIHEKKHPNRPADPFTRQPYTSAKAAFSDGPLHKSSIEHPQFTEALEQLEGDVVVLGGYRGSILRSADPPHRQLWVPIKVGLNLRKVDLEVGIDEEDDKRPSNKVMPSGMLTHIGPVDISRRLLKRLRSCENSRSGKLRVHEYGYDWRLHPLFLSKQLVEFLETLPSNRNQNSVPIEKRGALVVAHSLGGLITRHAVNQRPELFSGVVYAGVPKTCVNILGPLRNGDDVLLSSRVLTAQVNFTIRTSFALLPLNGRCFVDKETKEEYRVDFFDPQTWVDYRLSPCVARPLPPLTAPPKSSGISGYVSSMASALPSLPLPGRKASESKSKDSATTTMAGGVEIPDGPQSDSHTAVAHGNIAKPGNTGNDADDTDLAPPTVRTAVTMPREEAIEYLTRTLRTVKQFKKELAFNPVHHSSNRYPPISVIYGKTTPTVLGAKVNGREGIKHADAFDELVFASGDGVVLAKAAMVPQGYRTVRGGVVSSKRGHVTLLGDLEAVGKCINAVISARNRGVGLAE